jgi:hypothetical protein
VWRGTRFLWIAISLADDVSRVTWNLFSRIVIIGMQEDSFKILYCMQYVTALLSMAESPRGDVHVLALCSSWEQNCGDKIWWTWPCLGIVSGDVWLAGTSCHQATRVPATTSRCCECGGQIICHMRLRVAAATKQALRLSPWWSPCLASTPVANLR